MANNQNNYNGIVNVYKEAGYTSFDVVAKMRGICGQKKIGHTGTLDPDATGVLPVCLGNATKVCELLTDHDKEYIAELFLGINTDTQDASGQITGGIFESFEKIDLQKLPDEELVKSVIFEFVGEIMQIPPMYSALKVNGQKLYELARKGIEIERKARPVTIFDIEILDISLPIVKMKVHCSKGTYIRTLCEDIGNKLGCGGHMHSLVRSKVGPFVLKNAIKLSEIQGLKDENRLNEIVMPVDSLFMDCKELHVKDESMKLLLNGNVLKLENFETVDGIVEKTIDNKEMFRIYKADGGFAGIYYFNKKEKLFKPEKMFLS